MLMATVITAFSRRFVNATFNVIALESNYSVFRELHPPRLVAADDGIHFGFEPPQPLQNFVLEITVCNANDQGLSSRGMGRGFSRSFVVEISHSGESTCSAAG